MDWLLGVLLRSFWRRQGEAQPFAAELDLVAARLAQVIKPAQIEVVEQYDSVATLDSFVVNDGLNGMARKNHGPAIRIRDVQSSVNRHAAGCVNVGEIALIHQLQPAQHGLSHGIAFVQTGEPSLHPRYRVIRDSAAPASIFVLLLQPGDFTLDHVGERFWFKINDPAALELVHRPGPAYLRTGWMLGNADKMGQPDELFRSGLCKVGSAFQLQSRDRKGFRINDLFHRHDGAEKDLF